MGVQGRDWGAAGGEGAGRVTGIPGGPQVTTGQDSFRSPVSGVKVRADPLNSRDLLTQAGIRCRISRESLGTSPGWGPRVQDPLPVPRVCPLGTPREGWQCPARGSLSF